MRFLRPESWRSSLFAPRFTRVESSRSMADHSGQPTTSFNPSAFGQGKDAGTGGMSSEAYREFIRDMRRRYAEPTGMLCIGGFMLLMILLTAPLTLMDLASDGFTLSTIKQSSWLVVLALIAVYAFTSHGLTHKTMVKELLARSRCASCGFNLASIPPNDSGLTCCPECSARWRIPPATIPKVTDCP